MNTSSPILQAFYQAYYQWLQNPIEHPIFKQHFGLCLALSLYVYDVWPYQANSAILNEMVDQFENAGLSPTYPFNIDNTDFVNEMLSLKTHLNRRRRAWVYRHYIHTRE